MKQRLTWIDGAREDLRRLKRLYPFARQKAKLMTFEFTAKVDKKTDQFICMCCGGLMDDHSGISSYICPECRFILIKHTITTHTSQNIDSPGPSPIGA